MNGSLETKEKKRKVLNDESASYSAVINFSSEDSDHPVLEQPMISTEKVIFPAKETIFQESASESIDHDLIFNQQLPERAEILLNKGKLNEKQLNDPSFIHAVYYEYSHPKNKRGVKKAKKLGNKMVRHSFEALNLAEDEKERLLEIHRERVRVFLQDVSDQAYERSLTISIQQLPQDIQVPVLAAAYRTDLRSYFSAEVQKEYFATEKKVKSKLRSHYGTATDHEFFLDGHRFDLALSYEHKNIFIDELCEEDLPEELKAQVLNEYYRSGQDKVEKVYQTILGRVEERVYTNQFGAFYFDLLTQSLRDHLYFREQFIKEAKEQNPPLSSEEIGELDRLLQGKTRHVEDRLRTITEHCYQLACDALMANNPQICIRWKANSRMMEQACRLEERIRHHLILLRCDEETLENLIQCLRNRHQRGNNQVEKYLEELLPKAWRETEQQCDIRLSRIRELNNNICLLDEFRRLYRAVSSSDLSNWFKKKKSMPRAAQQVFRIVLKKIKEERGLAANWRPSVSLIIRAADHFDRQIEANQMAYDYVQEVMPYLKKIDRESYDFLLKFSHYAQEAIYTAIGSRMFSSDKVLAQAVALEEKAMLRQIEQLTAKEHFTGLFSAMMKCVPHKYAEWICPKYLTVNEEADQSIGAIISQSSIYGASEDVIETVTAVTNVAITGIMLQVNIDQCLKYSFDNISHLLADEEVPDAIVQQCIQMSAYLTVASSMIQSATRHLIKTGACPCSTSVQSVELSKVKNAVVFEQSEEESENKEETTNKKVLFNLLMKVFNEHKQEIFEGISAIYQVSTKFLAEIWNPRSCVEELINTYDAHNKKDSANSIDGFFGTWWSFINNQQTFGKIGYSIAQITLLELIANAENQVVKSILSPKQSTESLIFERTIHAVAKLSIERAIQRELFFSDLSLLNRLDDKIIMHTDS
ncbi:MAG: hypothetical protein AAGG81_03795 [Chlamydiota bacterium]